MTQRQAWWLEIAVLAVPLMLTACLLLSVAGCSCVANGALWATSALSASGSLVALWAVMLTGKPRILTLAVLIGGAAWSLAFVRNDTQMVAVGTPWIVQAGLTAALLSLARIGGFRVLKAKPPAGTVSGGTTLLVAPFLAILGLALAAYGAAAVLGVRPLALLSRVRFDAFAPAAAGAAMTPAVMEIALRRPAARRAKPLLTISSAVLLGLQLWPGLHAGVLQSSLVPQLVVLAVTMAALSFSGYRLVAPPASLAIAAGHMDHYIPASQRGPQRVGPLVESAAPMACVLAVGFIAFTNVGAAFGEPLARLWGTGVALGSLLATWAVLSPKGGPIRFVLALFALGMLVLSIASLRDPGDMLTASILLFRQYLATGFLLFFLRCMGQTIRRDMRLPRPSNAQRAESHAQGALASLFLWAGVFGCLHLTRLAWHRLNEIVSVFFSIERQPWVDGMIDGVFALLLILAVWAVLEARRDHAWIALFFPLAALASLVDLAETYFPSDAKGLALAGGAVLALGLWKFLLSTLKVAGGNRAMSCEPKSLREQLTLGGLLGWMSVWAIALGSLQMAPGASRFFEAQAIAHGTCGLLALMAIWVTLDDKWGHLGLVGMVVTSLGAIVVGGGLDPKAILLPLRMEFLPQDRAIALVQVACLCVPLLTVRLRGWVLVGSRARGVPGALAQRRASGCGTCLLASKPCHTTFSVSLNSALTAGDATGHSGAGKPTRNR